MSRGIWILAVCGSLALMAAAGLGDEPASRGSDKYPFDSAHRRPVGYYAPQSAGEKTAATQAPKNSQVSDFAQVTPGRPLPTTQRKPLPSLGSYPEEPAEGFHRVAPSAQNPFDFESEAFPGSPTGNGSSAPTDVASPTKRPVSTDALLQQAGIKPLPKQEQNGFEETATPATATSDVSGVQSANAEIPAAESQGNASATPNSQEAQPTNPPNTTAAISQTAPAGGAGATESGPQTPAVSLQWTRQTELTVGQECECQLVVKNTGSIPARDVSVDAKFPPTVEVKGTQPAAASSEAGCSWTFPELPPGGEATVRVRLVPTVRGDLQIASAVRFTGDASTTFQVAEPMLHVSITGPKEVMMGDPASQIILISNPGTGTANNVKIESVIPAGLEHPRGDRLVMEIGSLGPGETRSVRLGLAAVEGGDHVVEVLATADTALAETATADIHVIAPSIKIALEGPGLRYIGRSAKYTLTVTNEGTAASNNVRVMHKVPEGFQFAGADNGGKFDPATSTATWYLNRLEPAQSAQVTIELLPIKLGEYVQLSGVVTELGTTATAELHTQVDGTASLVLEIADRNDPVEVGADTTYEVRVKNEGSKAASNVALACEIPEGVQFIDCKGPVEGQATNGTLVFQNLEQLEPGATATFLIHVKGKVEGNHRFRARLASDSIQEPLIFEELTKFYGG